MRGPGFVCINAAVGGEEDAVQDDGRSQELAEQKRMRGNQIEIC